MARLSQLDADTSSESRTWTRRSMSSWCRALLDRLAGSVVRLPVQGWLAGWCGDYDPGRPSFMAVLHGGLDGLGHCLLAELLGQFTDLGFWVAAVAAEGPQERQLAFLGPAGDGLWRHMQDVGHLGGP